MKRASGMVAALIVLLGLSGCQWATVTEYFEITPAEAETVGPGVVTAERTDEHVGEDEPKPFVFPADTGPMMIEEGPL